MHIAVGNSSSTLRATIITFLLGTSAIANASYIKHDLISFSNDRINNICFQKYFRASYELFNNDQRWRHNALATCRLTPKEVKESFFKKIN